MKPRLLFLLPVALGALASSALAATPADRPRLTDDLRRRVGEVAPAPNKSAAPATADNALIMLEPVGVTGTYVPPPRRPEEEMPKSQPFTWLDGGTMLKKDGATFTLEQKLQYNPVHRGFDFLTLSW